MTLRQVVTIDGPAGAGKSTAARRLAERLGWRFLDTGAMYRAVALAAIRSGIVDDEAALSALAAGIEVRLDGLAVFLNDEDVSEAIRDPEVSQASSRVARCGAIRERLVGWQRQFALQGSTVTEGRDQGTVVFPDALCKIFLTASPEERAGRRHAELRTRGETVDAEMVLREQRERDDRDARRLVGPLRPAGDALIVDTTGLAIDDVVDLIASRIDGSRSERESLARLSCAWTPDHSRLVAVGRTMDDVARAVTLGTGGGCVVVPPEAGDPRSLGG